MASVSSCQPLPPVVPGGAGGKPAASAPTAQIKPVEGPPLWLSCDRWPSPRTLESFTSDIWRLENNPAAGQERAIALWHWIRRVFIDSGLCQRGPRGQEAYVHDSLWLLNAGGGGHCPIYGNFAADVGTAAGLKSRPVHLPHHTMTEYWYADADGVERWHLYDAHTEWFIYAKDGQRVCGLEELLADPSHLFTGTKKSVPFMTRENVTPGNPEVLVGANYFPRVYEKDYDWSPGKLWSVNHSMDMRLRPGESFTRYWDAHLGGYVTWEHQQLYFGPAKKSGMFGCKAGFHDSTPAHFVDGTLKDPTNYPYYRRYMTKCNNPDCYAFNQPGRPNGCGLWTYQPVLTADRIAADAAGSQGLAIDKLADGSPAIRPAKAGEYAEVVYRLASPYMFIDCAVEFDVLRRQGQPSWKPQNFNDDVDVLLSVDGGKNWQSMSRVKRALPEPTHARVTFGKEEWIANAPSAYGQHECLVAFRLRASENPADTAIGNIRFTASTHLNMFALPFLQPGRNQIKLDGRLDAGRSMRVVYRWLEGEDTPAGGKAVEKSDTQVLKDLPATYTINAAGSKPDDIRMLSVEMKME